MADKFMKLDEDKRQRIVKASLREFALRGYEDGKTDNIVREAGISKGLLFHYFGTKKNLFLFLFDYAMEIAAQQMSQLSMDADIFERIRQNTILKLKYFRKFPEVMNFGASVRIKGLGELADELGPRLEPMNRMIYASMIEGLDLSLFKDEVDPRTAVNIILWTLQGLTGKILADYQEKYRNLPLDGLESTFADYIAEVDAYLHILRKSLYK